MWHLIDERPLPSEADDNIPESEDLNFLLEDSAVDEGEWYREIRDEDHGVAPSEFPPGLDGESQIGRESEDPVHEVSDSSFSRLAAHSSFKRLRLERPRQAWESHPTFNRKSGSSSLHAWASAAFLPSVGVRETLNFPKPEESYGGEDAAHVPWTIERRLKGVRIQRSDEDERNHALKKLKAVVLLDPLATALGKSLVQKTGALETEEIIAASFSDAFSSKSAGTLTKRAGSLQRLVVQLYKQGVASPWRMEEADLYSALTTLREEGCGATSPAHMLESLHFLHAIARFLHLDLELVISARCKGVAHSCFMSKAPLEQRDPLTCFQVRRLEEAMVRAGPVGQCILGQILFCVHAVCRWKDSQKLKLLELLGTGESQILFGDALGSKTSLSKEAKTKFTPYAALAQGLTECSWARLWIEARRQCRLKFGAGPDGFCLPTRSQRLDEWGSTPMGAGEASSYLAEILEGSETEGQVLGTHSLKVTLLTWASRSTVVRLSKGERLLLGHHIVPGVKSMVTYSREAYTSLIGKLLALYRSIRSGAFQPDLAPADRVLQVADALAAAEEGQGLGTGARDEAAAEQLAGFEGESEDSADDAEADGPFELPGQPAVRAEDMRICFADAIPLIAKSWCIMASANLDSEAAFLDRARKIGLSEETLTGLLNNSFNTFGRLAFAVSATPTTLTDEAVDNWIDGLGMRPSGFQKASLRRLLFEGVSMAIEEVRTRIEPGVEGHPKKLAAAERLDRQAKQERSLGGLVFTPETRPANSCVDLCVEMLETGVLQYHVPSKWISRAQEAQCLKRDSSINIDADNNLKIATKSADQTCDVSSEMRLRQAWSRRSLAFDLANLASFRVMEEHVQFLFSVLQRAQPKGFQGVMLSQIIEADKQMFILASNNLMGRLTASPGAAPALDAEISRLSRSPDIMQYLAPLQNPVIPHVPSIECVHQWRERRGRIANWGQITSDDLLTLFDMLPQGNLQKGQREVKQSFVTGCYSQGGFRGLRKECAEFPYASRVMTRFVQERLPGHVFSTCGIFADSLTPLHRDGRNAQWPNAVFRLSDFKEGGLWIEGPGDDVRVFNSKELVGAVHEIGDDPLIFDVEAAHQLNFVLPPEVPLPVQTAQLGERLIVLKRNLAVARVKQEVKRCSDAEAELHKAMHPAVAKVMSGKSILALESLLKSEGYDDLEVIGFLKEGVRLVGTSQCPECFDRKFVPAFLTETELMASAATRRKSLLSKFEKVDPEEARILKEATDEEVAMGFLEGPYYDQSQITKLLGTNDWTVIRRFVLLQGAELKPRPIDNCLESQLNAGYSSSIHLRLQDSDYISAMALHVAREVSEGRAHKDASEWKGKTLDLSKAYKQLAIHPSSAENADSTASAFLDALGWRHAKTGAKGIGLAAHDCFSGTGWVFTGKVPLQLLESWKAEVGEQLICEIEMFAVLASLLQLNALVSSRRIVWWVDNDATRGVMIKGASRSWAMHTLARVFSELDREWPSMWWVCRVPSYSNPGDAPSRDQGEESLVTVGASCVQPFSRLEELVGRIQAFNRA
ncbi:unnamed protein product [Symbiodinium sp. CCMP2592]|nr:unnamed protein product [Symbiodinium sp. CCMP2592]